MIKKINYITYQTFPATTANTLQTISNIKYIIKNGVEVTLIFPLREVQSSSDLSTLKEFYNISENFKVVGTAHNLPFGKYRKLNRISFLISHFFWSYSTIKNLEKKEYKTNEYYFTRSDWVFYFLSRRGEKVIYECHQYTKLRKLLIKISLRNEYSKIIFLNELLKDDYSSKYILKNNYRVLQNGVDVEMFENSGSNNMDEIIFIGRLTRFNNPRNIDFLFKGIAGLEDKYSLKIIGASKDELKLYTKLANQEKIQNRVTILESLSHAETISHLQNAGVGILINSKSNQHSIRYTSPLKYFEYLAAGLKVVAVNFKAHNILPYSEEIIFFEDDNIKSFQNAILESSNTESSIIDNKSISLDFRVKSILNFLSN